MGFQDRDYYREEQPGVSLRGPRTVIGWIILINVVIFCADGLVTPKSSLINNFLALHVGDLAKPWYWWRFLTYGFAHASFSEPNGVFHIIGNMLGLFFLGRAIEQFHGRREFLRFYLTTVVVAGLVWALANLLAQAPPQVSAVGASGAVVGVVILFALKFPRQTLLLSFVIPVPAWVVGVLVVVGDLFAAMNAESSRIAWQAHLAGAAFAFLYFHNRWNLTRILPNLSSVSRFKPRFKRRPKFRVYDPQGEATRHDDLTVQVDKILEKIHRHGEDSLTSKERRMLKNASRQYQKKQRGPDT